MPYLRDGKCVFRKNADGSKGASKGCSDTVEMAKSHMRALYANESPKAKAIQKAIGDIAVLFSLGDNPDLIKAQAAAKAADSNLVENDPSTFHITAVMTNGSNAEALVREMEWGFESIALIVDSISSFERPDGSYVIYAYARWSSDLRYMQERIFSAMTSRYSQEDAVMISSYSLPDWWIPHITLGTSSTPVYMEIEPFAILVNKIIISDADQVPVESYMLRAIDPNTMITKAVQLQVITKGVHFTEEEDLVIPLIAIPFKGPMSVDVGGGIMKSVADLQGDWFHEETELPMVSEVGVNWDHDRWQNYAAKEMKSLGLDSEEIEALGADFGFAKNRDIGVASKGDTTEDGIIYNVIVNRRTKYLKGLGRAAKEGLIGGSGEFKSFEYDPDIPGKVNFADLVKIALTPSPFNIEARALNKSVELEENPVPDKKLAPISEKGAGDPAPAGDPVVPVVPEVPAAKPKLVDTIRAKGVELNSEPAVEEEETVKVETITITKAQFDEMMTVIQSIPAIVSKSIDTFTDELREALPTLGEIIVESLRPTVEKTTKETVAKSKLELTAETIFDKKNAENVPQAARSTVIKHEKSQAMANYPGAHS